MTTGAGNTLIDTVFFRYLLFIQLIQQQKARLLHGGQQKEDGK